MNDAFRKGGERQMTEYKDLIMRLRDPARRLNRVDREAAADIIEKLTRKVRELPVSEETRQLFFISNNGGYDDD
jgi:hypothetical protein